MSPAESLQAAQALGLTLPSPAYILGAVVFGLVGLAAWRWGRAAEVPRVRWLGAALMFFPYVVERTWLMYLVGCLLCAAIWWNRPGRG